MEETVGDVGRRMPRICVALDSRQAYYQSHMIELEGMINNQPISSWIDSGTKRKVSELVKDCVINMKGVSTKAFLNVIPLGSYDCLIGMDWLDKHHAVLDCHSETFTCLDGEGSHRTVQGVGRLIAVREISAWQLKKEL